MSPPAWATASAVSRIMASLSTEQGPAINTRSLPPNVSGPTCTRVPSGTRRRSTSGMSGFFVWCAGVGGGAESLEPSTQAS